MNKTLGMGLTFKAGDNALRVAVSVKFQTYPFHQTRKVRIAVGELCVYDRMWDAAGKQGALEALQAIGEVVSELIEALGKVTV